MVAIHVSWYKNKFYIWAESTDYIEDAAESTLFHPYLFDQDDLLLWLEGILGSEIEEERLTILTGIFPCNSGIPEVSPMLEQFADNTQEINSSEVANITMNSFKVHCYELSIQEYTDLFKQTLESQDLGYEINASSDTLFWSYIYQWMLKAIANKILCPMIEKNENRLNSYWRLPITGLDRDTLKQLADYLPLSAHCLGLTLEEIKNQFPTSVIYESMQFLANNWILLREKKSKSKAKELPKMIEKYIGDEWLKTLDNAEISINYPSEITPKIDFFIEKLNTWQLKLKYEDDILLKVLFKFHYPEEESDEWLIEYTIQSYLDKDICLPLSYVLQNMNRSADYFNIPIEKFSQTLCFLLGHTNHTLPKFTLEFTPEKAYTNIISTEKVYSLWEQTNLLQDNKLVDFTFPFNRGDFESFDITARVNSFSDTNHYFSINRLVSFDWKLSIGDNTLTKKELDALVKSKIPLVQVNGQWKILNRSSLQPIIRKMNKYKKKTSLKDLLLDSMKQEDPYSRMTIDLSEQFNQLKDILNGSISQENIIFPDSLQDILRHYQKDGIAWLWKLKQVSFHPILADDMGLGKTLQILVFLLKEKTEKKIKKPSLVICPTAVLENWQRESIKFTDSLLVHIHHGADRFHKKEFAKNAKKFDLVLTSYNLAMRDVEDLQKVKWNNVILDEAQNIKNPHAKKTTAIKTIPSEFRIAMTGTPVENHVGDLWSIFDFLQPGWLGGEKQFQTSFLRPIQKKRDPNKIKTLQKMTQPFILRRLKTDPSIVPDLPDKIESKEYCLLTKEQVSLYEACLKSSLGEIENSEGIARKGKVLTLLLHLKQICNHPAHYLKELKSSSNSSKVDNLASNMVIDYKRSGKLKRLWTLIEEILEYDEKVLLFTQYKEMGSLLKTMLSESFSESIHFYHGGLTRKKRDEMICNFQENQNVKLMILSLKAGGIGLNLTAANHVFHIDRWWNPAVENQATDRAFRIGQKKNVHVHKMICTGTMEETIDQLIETKSSIADEIMGSKTSLLTEMSTTQLKSLFELRKDILNG